MSAAPTVVVHDRLGKRTAVFIPVDERDAQFYVDRVNAKAATTGRTASFEPSGDEATE